MKKKEPSKNKTTPKTIAGIKSPAVLNPHLKKILAKKRKPKSNALVYVEKIQKGDKVALSQAITIIESTQATDQNLAEKNIEACLPFANKSIRIGITGTPGVGKSTFIESFGKHLIGQGHQLGVLAIDPTSPLSKGSILGMTMPMARDLGKF